VRTAIVASLVASVLAGCATAPLETAGCERADEQLVERAASRLVAAGELRNGFVVDSDDRRFLSAELLEPDDDPEADGVILTWEIASATSLISVDERARRKTEWPGSDEIDVRDDGAMSSRGCVLEAFRAQ
jgi:hypothetical protein